MALGIITGSTANSVIAAKIEWEAVTDVTTNSSDVTARLYLRRTNSYTGTATGGLNALKLQIGNTEFTGNGQMFTVPNNGEWVLACEGTATVEHEPDGTKTVCIKAFGGLEGCSVKSVDCAEEVVLDNISRGTRIASFESRGTQGLLNEGLKLCFEQNSIQYNYHRLRLLDGATEIIEPVSPGDLRNTPVCEFELTKEKREDIYRAHTDTNKVTLTAELTTYADEACKTQVGIKDTAELELAMPEDEVKPTLEVTVAPVYPEGKWFDANAYSWSRYICDKTGVHVTVEPKTQYGADGNTMLTVDGMEVKHDNGEYESDVLTKTGKIEIACILIDSRGHKAEQKKTIVVQAYTEPKLTVTRCCRCTDNGEPDSKGEYLCVDAVLEHTAFDGHSDDDNPCELSMQLKGTGKNDAAAEHLLLYGNTMGQSHYEHSGVAASIDLEGGSTAPIYLDTQKSYRVLLIARDRLGEDYTIEFLIPTAKVQCHEGDGFLALGQYSAGPGVDIAADWPVRIRGEVCLWEDDKKDFVSLAEYIRKIINGG